MIRNSVFHACTLSTGAVHPLVEHEGFFGTFLGKRYFDFYDFCVCGDFVAAGASVHSVSVWNWKTGHLIFEKVSINHLSFLFNSLRHFMQISENYWAFDFVDENHIILPSSMEDSIYVCNLRPRNVDEFDRKQQQQKDEEIGAELQTVRFQLALPPIIDGMTSRQILLHHNGFPKRQAPSTSGRTSGGARPFHADPRERLIMLRISTMSIGSGNEECDLHLPARALLDHFAAAAPRQRGESREPVVVPWSAWCDSVCVTPPFQQLQLQTIACGMRVLSNPPDRDEGVQYIDSYLPQSSRREAGVAAEVRGWNGTRQAFRLPREIVGKENLLSVMCEDALLCFEVRHCVFYPVLLLAFLTRTFLFHNSLIIGWRRSRMRIGIPFEWVGHQQFGWWEVGICSCLFHALL